MPHGTEHPKVCENGHVMDADWQVCPYCPSRSVAGGLAATVRVASSTAEAALAATVHVPRPTDIPAPPELARTVRIDADAAALPPELARTVRIATPAPAQAAPVAEPAAAPAARRTEFLQRPAQMAAIGWLVAAEGPDRGAIRPVDRERVNVGALPDCDVVIDSPHVSGKHARIRCRGREFVITDLDSANGTLVNGATVHQHPLQDGDRVSFGSSHWIFKTVAFDEA